MPRRRQLHNDDDNDKDEHSNDENSDVSMEAAVTMDRNRKRPKRGPTKDDNFDDDDDDNDDDNDNGDEDDSNQEDSADTTAEENLRLLTDSGLTEDDRRQIRREQRELLKELTEDRGAEGDQVEQARSKNNRLYRKVRYTREAVLDGENLLSIAHKASQKVDRLIQVRSTIRYVVSGRTSCPFLT
jgi:hypothetical protein